jgi:dihydroxyacetone kinase-like protein
MKKLMNDPMEFVDETLEGIVYAYPDQLRFPAGETRGIVRADAPIQGKVAIATGGGAGHLPLFLGYVGKGLADGSSVGNVFTSPSADAMVSVAKEIDGGEGVLFLYGHYFGDKMNFDLAAEMLEEDGIIVKTVRVSDDVASASRDHWRNRRGVAGIFFAYKIAGACAESMQALDKVTEIADKTASNIATMGVALSSCTIPASGKPTFEIGLDEMEMGMGIHGEPGIKRSKLGTAKEISEDILSYLIEDLGLQSGDEVAVLINGSGATPLEELFVVNREVHLILARQAIPIYKSYVGEFATSMEMAGCSITLLKLDEELKGYLDAPAASPFFKQLGREI